MNTTHPASDSAPLPEPQFLKRDNGERIAYHQTPGRNPGVVFMTGFKSDMTGGKALALEAFCKARGNAFLRFDYQGHGQSDGLFKDGTIGRWASDAIYALDQLTEGPQVLVGSSMGGWIMTLTAKARAERIAGLVGIAAAPDFTEDLIDSHFTPAQKAEMDANDFVDLPNCYDDEPYIITRALIEDGRDNLVLREPIELDVPVHLIHGQMDEDVPWQTAFKLQEAITGDDVEITFIKKGDHRLSTDHDLDRLCRTVERTLTKIDSGLKAGA